MKIVVCMKQVPDTNEIKIDQKTGTLKREGVPAIMNPEDKHALLAALKIKNAEIIALSMGPPQAEMILREALAYGADKAVLLCDFAFAGSDTAATSYALAQAIKKIDPMLIMCGRQAIDGDTAQVGPQIAELLQIPQITYVQKIINLSKDKIEAEKETEIGHDIIECKLPALITCTDNIAEIAYPSLQGIEKAFESKIETWKAENINAEKEKLGLKGSPTWVNKSFTPSQQRQGNILRGNSKELAKQLADMLIGKEIVK
ncbi:electron transfer flavoprotein subunit beta [Candidatus Woesearchaeota archaeon]|nr:electron transfer flavoprotein subunit beta [Candidatus Woesearchaeota archaeon]